jgi:hypothetical protein
MDIRLLKANEIECRIGRMNDKGIALLLYKDARADMKILDEVFGFDGWEREHQLIDGKLFCTVRVWSEKRNCWISKQDVGTESMTEKEKGQASDSFKRAGFNWNIGRELYTAPFIWIKLDASEVNTRNGKPSTYTKFLVKEIGYNEHREINKLVISDEKGKVRYSMGGTAKVEQPKPKESDEDDLIQMAYSDITNAKDVASLQEVWANYKSLQSNKKFVTAVTAKKTAILNGL